MDNKTELIRLSEAVAWLAYGRPMNCETQCSYERQIGIDSEDQTGPAATFWKAHKRILQDAASGRLIVYGHRKALGEDANFPRQFLSGEQIPASAFVGDLYISPAEPYALGSGSHDVLPEWYRLHVNTNDFIDHYPEIHSVYRSNYVATEQDDILEAVARGKMTPAEADAWAQEKGLPTFSGARRQFDPMGEIYWSLPMVGAWIIWRTAADVTGVCRQRTATSAWSYRKRHVMNQETGNVELVMGHSLEFPSDSTLSRVWLLGLYPDDRRQVMPPQAREDLRSKLQSGELIATGLADDGKRREIQAYEWQDLSLNDDNEPADSIHSAHTHKLVYENVTVARDDVLRLWKQEAVGLAAPSRREDRTGAPGRPSSAWRVEQELRRRAANGLIRERLSDEAVELTNWLKSAHPESPPMTRKAIENRIRSEFNSINAKAPKL